jgi:mitogen-activated protein kinase 1/3
VYTNDVPADVVATVVDVPFMVGEVVEVLKDDGETWVDAKVETTFTTDSIDEVDGQVYTILRGTIKVSCELGTKYVMADDVGFTLRKKIEDSTLPKLPGHLQVVQQLGEGAYGEVFLCEDDRDGSQVAVKWVREFTRDPLFGKRVLREIRILAAMDHPNLLQLIDVLPVPRPDFDDVYFVMPYMHCDLHKVIYSKAVLSESHSQAFTCQILRGLKYLHSAGVVHRDLKPGNILVNRDCTLRIADLGLARGRAYEEEELTDYVVTRWYRAPELMLLPSGYFEAIDLWSVGCIHVELHTRRPLFPGENHVSMLRSIAKTLGFNQERDLGWLPTEGKAREGALNFVSALCLPESPTKSLEERMPQASQPCLEFVRQLLMFDPNSRLSAVDALSHEYLERLKDPMAEVTATRQFAWDFDRFDATERALKDRVYAECARHHPEILSRDAEIIAQRGMAPMLNAYSGTKGCVTPPARAPRKRSRTPGASSRRI